MLDEGVGRVQRALEALLNSYPSNPVELASDARKRVKALRSMLDDAEDRCDAVGIAVRAAPPVARGRSARGRRVARTMSTCARSSAAASEGR